MKKSKLLLTTGLAVLLLGCANTSGGADEKLDVVESKLERNMAPQSSVEEQKGLAKNNNDFTFKMFNALQEEEQENIFFSPYSISTALVMTYAGAEGKTKSQMAEALHFKGEDAMLHNNFNAIDLRINHEDSNYTLSVANALWPAKEFSFRERYLDTIKENYGAKLRVLDYLHDTEGSRQTINRWIENKTHDRIKNIIKEGSLSSSTRLTLVNAIYFKAEWEKKFSSYLTQNETFTKEDGSTVQHVFMNLTDSFLYTEHDDFQAIHLRYQGDRSSMVVLLPKVGKYTTVMENLDSYYDLISNEASYQSVQLKLPKFELTTKGYQLQKPFKKLGMVDAFQDNADFRGITEGESLKIDEIIHKAFIKVDENGSEAAAATVVTMRVTSVEPEEESKEMFVNRPFLFFIKDNMSHQILFMGWMKTLS